MDIYLVYATFENEKQANEISKSVVEQRLAACANIFSPHKSIYWWEGKLESSQECAAIFKTTVQQADALKDKIVELHSYDVPCVVAFAIEDGNTSFLQWIEQEVMCK